MFLIPYLHQLWLPDVPGCILSSPSGDGQIIADVCATRGPAEGPAGWSDDTALAWRVAGLSAEDPRRGPMLAELAHLERERPTGWRSPGVTLVSMDARLLPELAPGVARKASAVLRSLGVDVRLRTRVTAVEPTAVRLVGLGEDGAATRGDEERLPCAAALWAGGIRPAPVLELLGLPRTPEGWLAVFGILLFAATGLAIFGVILPLLACLVELSSHTWAGLTYDPHPTWLHVGLILLVPAGNLAVLLHEQGHLANRSGWVWLLNGASRAILRMLGVKESNQSEILTDSEIEGLVEESAEHGKIILAEPSDTPGVGERIFYRVGYSDQCNHLHENFYGVRNGYVETIWPILGRGKLQ